MTRNDNGATVKLSAGEYLKLAGLVLTLIVAVVGSLWRFSISVTTAQARTEAQIEAIHSRLNAIERKD